MAKRKRTKGQTTIYKTPNVKPKDKLTINQGVNSGAPVENKGIVLFYEILFYQI